MSYSDVKCCICGRPLWTGNPRISDSMKDEYFGNNPYPVDTTEDARCCDECNNNIVVPARIAQLFK